MLSSKATAALMRLKEIDRKYKSTVRVKDERANEVNTASSISLEVPSGSADSKNLNLSLNLKTNLNVSEPPVAQEKFERNESKASSTISIESSFTKEKNSPSEEREESEVKTINDETSSIVNTISSKIPELSVLEEVLTEYANDSFEDVTNAKSTTESDHVKTISLPQESKEVEEPVVHAETIEGNDTNNSKESSRNSIDENDGTLENNNYESVINFAGKLEEEDEDEEKEEEEKKEEDKELEKPEESLTKTQYQKSRTTPRKKESMGKPSNPRKSPNAEGAKHLAYNSKKIRRLRRQMAAIQLQQERENFHKYLEDLKRIDLRFGIHHNKVPSYDSPSTSFKSLKFPNLENFAMSDTTPTRLKPEDRNFELYQRILTIKQWLKDQYTLYRDYSVLARTINAVYVPATLKDCKKTIREFQTLNES